MTWSMSDFGADSDVEFESESAGKKRMQTRSRPRAPKRREVSAIARLEQQPSDLPEGFNEANFEQRLMSMIQNNVPQLGPSEPRVQRTAPNNLQLLLRNREVGTPTRSELEAMTYDRRLWRNARWKQFSKQILTLDFTHGTV